MTHEFEEVSCNECNKVLGFVSGTTPLKKTKPEPRWETSCESL